MTANEECTKSVAEHKQVKILHSFAASYNRYVILQL